MGGIIERIFGTSGKIYVCYNNVKLEVDTLLPNNYAIVYTKRGIEKIDISGFEIIYK